MATAQYIKVDSNGHVLHNSNPPISMCCAVACCLGTDCSDWIRLLSGDSPQFPVGINAVYYVFSACFTELVLSELVDIVHIGCVIVTELFNCDIVVICVCYWILENIPDNII